VNDPISLSFKIVNLIANCQLFREKFFKNETFRKLNFYKTYLINSKIIIYETCTPYQRIKFFKAQKSWISNLYLFKKQNIFRHLKNIWTFLHIFLGSAKHFLLHNLFNILVWSGGKQLHGKSFVSFHFLEFLTFFSFFSFFFNFPLFTTFFYKNCTLFFFFRGAVFPLCLKF